MVKKILLFLIGALIAACTKHIDSTKETILAKIENKSISVNEFIRRAEYTIRPPYCRGDNYIHRKIVLNSLIAEKLLALEAGENNELTQNYEFQQYLKGRKEQAMRQWLFYEVAQKPVKLDSSEVKRLYKLAGRLYNVSYLNCPEATTANIIYQQLQSGHVTFKQVAKKLTGKDKVPQREIKFDAPEPDIINQALYQPTIKKGQLIGPLQVAPDSYVILRIDGWRDFVAMSTQQQANRLKLVKDKLTERLALLNYEKFIGHLMADKQLKFNPVVFKKLVNILGSEYFKTKQEKKEMFNKKFWHKDNQMMIKTDKINELEEISNEPFFTIDGKTWTVRNFMNYLLRHPLVFRRKKFPKSQFARHFRQAVADLVRDYYLTKEAYQRGYDNVPEVKRYTEMWKDNLLALYQKKKYLDQHKIKNKKGTELIKEVLDPYLATLREKYQNKIEINTDAFEKIRLTRIDMFAIQPNQAFPVVVPSFPQLTLHDKLDYGKKMIVQE